MYNMYVVDLYCYMLCYKSTNFLSFYYVPGTMLKSLQKLFNFHNPLMRQVIIFPILHLGKLKTRKSI